MRALQPQVTGLARNPTDGVQIHYEVFDPQAAERTILCLPAWSIVHSRVWKMQVAYFARHFRVVTFDGPAKFNYPFWRTNYADFLQFFFSQAANEPHSTKLIEDGVAWGLETDPETLIATNAVQGMTEDEACAPAKRVRCPVLVVHGDQGAIAPHARGEPLAEATGGTMVTLHGSGHMPQGRDPVKVNLQLHQFLGRPEPRRLRPTWRRAMSRKCKRALFVSSPIGLWHAQRDVAIAEGWDIDYYLHENPELKTAPFAWLTDFVGWLPMHADERWLTTDYNAEMIEQIDRFPRLRNQFEQTFHVPLRLANYGVAPDARVDFADATPERLAERIVQALGCTPIYRPVESDGAAGAARSLAELLYRPPEEVPSTAVTDPPLPSSLDSREEDQ